MSNQTRVEKLVTEVLSVAQEAHPEYTHEQQLAWALGILAETVLRKNHMDSIVFSELNHKLNSIVNRKKYQ